MTKNDKILEMQIISKILSYEQENLTECLRRLSKYETRLQELDIEIRTVLEQQRAVNKWGLVTDYDLKEMQKLPSFYSSKIICAVYKNGKILTKYITSDIGHTFSLLFVLVNARKNEVKFFETPFVNPNIDNFDKQIEEIVIEANEYILQQQINNTVFNMINENLFFKMPIDDIFEVNEASWKDFNGVFITGHIEKGLIVPNALVDIVNDNGDIVISCKIIGIVLQSNMLKLKNVKMKSATKGQSVGLIFDNKEILNFNGIGMSVVINKKANHSS